MYTQRHTCTHTHVSVQFRSVAQSCLTLCDPMNRSTPGLPVHHQLPEFTQTQTHVHRVYIHTYIYSDTHRHTCRDAYIHTHAGTHTYTHAHSDTHSHTHIDTHMCRHTYIHTLIHTDTHSWTPTQTHRCTHTDTQMGKDQIWGSVSSSAEAFYQNECCIFHLSVSAQALQQPRATRGGVYNGKSKQDTVCSVICGLGGTALQEVW